MPLGEEKPSTRKRGDSLKTCEVRFCGLRRSLLLSTPQPFSRTAWDYSPRTPPFFQVSAFFRNEKCDFICAVPDTFQKNTRQTKARYQQHQVKAEWNSASSCATDALLETVTNVNVQKSRGCAFMAKPRDFLWWRTSVTFSAQESALQSTARISLRLWARCAGLRWRTARQSAPDHPSCGQGFPCSHRTT